MLQHAVLSWLVGLVLLQAAPPSDEQLQTWIRQLGDPKLSVRSEATDQLWKAGDAATKALEAASADPDLEVATRARYVLDRIRAGIVPGSDPELTRAVEQFRFGDINAKRQAFDILVKKNQIDRLRWLIDRETDQNVRSEFNQRLLADLLKQVSTMIVDGDEARVIQALTEVSRRGGAQHLATYLHLNKQAEPQIAKLRAMADLKPDSPDGTLLWYLLRLQGDLPGAKVWADKAANKSWSLAYASAAYDWPMLFGERTRAAPPANADINMRVRYWGSVAIFRRAAGNTKAYDEARQKLVDLKESANDSEIGRIAETLVLLGELKTAEELLRGQRRVQLAELLMHQGRYREAFDALAIHDPRNSAVAWFEKLDPNDHRVRIQDPSHPFHAGRLAARMLYSLGEKDQALKLFDALAKINTDDATHKFAVVNVAKAEFDLGIVEQAEQHIGEAIELSGYAPVFRTLLPRNNGPAERWYARLSELQPNEPKANIVRMVRQLLSSVYRPRMADDVWNRTIDEAAVAIETMPEPQRANWWRMLAEACVVRGERDRAIGMLKNAASAETTTGYAHWLRIGDLHAGANDWKAAAEAYYEAWNLDRRQALALHLHGHALTKTGEQEKGGKLIRQALLLPLGDLNLRHTVATGLKERNLRRLAEVEFDLETRLSLFQDFNVLLAGQELAQLRGIREPAATMNYWQLMIARVIELGATIERDGTLRLPQNIHRLRFLDLIQQKKYDELGAEMERVQQFVPHDGDLVMGALGRLLKIDRKAEADAAFDRGYQALENIVNDFPNAAIYHNNLAWVAARCARRLDDALKHAQKAVELTPDHAGHIDTLAEVHFQRGDRAEAIKLEKRAMELEPASNTYKIQLERFEKGEPGPVYTNPGES
jgi:tetratricopeptide (TPR) repeat protein